MLVLVGIGVVDRIRPQRDLRAGDSTPWIPDDSPGVRTGYQADNNAVARGQYFPYI